MHDGSFPAPPDPIPPPRPVEAAPPAPPVASPWGEGPEPVEAPEGLLAVGEALLKSPAAVLAALDRDAGTLGRLGAIAALALAATGVGIATFTGDLQLVAVPLKLVLGTFLCAALCLPSLHVFSCLSGATQSIRQTAGAVLMGVALMGILLAGFAPVVWVFAQATTSIALVGTLHLGFFLASAALGLALTRRALGAMNHAPVRGAGPWAVMFVCVMLQMSTTLRPIVGPFDGLALHDRVFFLAHWLS